MHPRLDESAVPTIFGSLTEVEQNIPNFQESQCKYQCITIMTNNISYFGSCSLYKVLYRYITGRAHSDFITEWEA